MIGDSGHGQRLPRARGASGAPGRGSPASRRGNPALEALILDFFGGSGTTLHATLLLNEADGGSRRCILVTNNEIGPAEQSMLKHKGVKTGSAEWDSHGIFEAVTRPRIEAAITGRRSDGSPLAGSYAPAPGAGGPGRPMSAGFDAAAEFLEIA